MGEKIVNGVLFLLSVTYTWFARAYAFGSLTAPKTGFLPQIVGWCAVAVSGYLFVMSLAGKGDSRDVKLTCDFKRLGLLILSMAIYIFCFRRLGYLISTTALLCVVMKIGGVHGIKLPVFVSVLTSGFFYLVFAVFLSVPIPTGSLF